MQSIVDLQALHLEMSNLFAPNADSVPKVSQQARHAQNLVLSFYIGSVFIFFNHIYECFLNVSPERWRRLRRELSKHVQKRLQSMKPRLEQALAEAHDIVLAALRQQNEEHLSASESPKHPQRKGLIANNQE